MPTKSDSLLLTDQAWNLPSEFYSCWNARGLYNPLQFVLRLRPDVHRALSSAPTGLVSANEMSSEQVMAFSTYLHENIHWWQHAGSTTGLFLSLIYPAQSHINSGTLKEILAEIGPVMSIRSYHQNNADSTIAESESTRKINVVLNNWHDIEFYRWLVIDPQTFKAKDKANDDYFECVGHSYEIAIGAVLWLLSSTVDPDYATFPDARSWQPISRQLREDRKVGFYYQSPIRIPPIGAREIFEGQARFSQLQYLHLFSGRKTGWSEFEALGMLKDVYVSAFDYFLNITQLEPNANLDGSVVGLFLLVCDISINPAEGFIEDPAEFEKLIEVHDPGIRFLNLCKAIGERKEEYLSCIDNYSADEYWTISDRLCAAIGVVSMQTLIQKVTRWSDECPGIAALLAEDETFAFAAENLPVRVFLARFIRYQIDKAKTPEFFCWPGVWMTKTKENGISTERALALYEEHRALFLDKEDGDVYPRTFDNRNEKTVHATFEAFYAWVAIYELTRQWLVGSSGFDYDFAWLSSKHQREEMEAWVGKHFEDAYGVSPASFRVV